MVPIENYERKLSFDSFIFNIYLLNRIMKDLLKSVFMLYPFVESYLLTTLKIRLDKLMVSLKKEVENKKK